VVWAFGSGRGSTGSRFNHPGDASHMVAVRPTTNVMSNDEDRACDLLDWTALRYDTSVNSLFETEYNNIVTI
jgi:hypothetical protein